MQKKRKALLQFGRFLAQFLGAAVGGKLMRLRSRSALPRSRYLVRFVAHHRPHPFREWLSS